MSCIENGVIWYRHYKEGRKSFPMADIDMFRASDKYVEAHHANGMFIIEHSLRQLIGLCSNDFINVHRSYLVRKSLIKRLHRVRIGEKSSDLQHYVVLTNGTKLPVSRRKANDLKALGYQFTA